MEIATTLLQYGAETNIQTKQGVMPLHLASQEGHSEMAALLLQRGANVNAPTKVNNNEKPPNQSKYQINAIIKKKEYFIKYFKNIE